MLLLTNVSALSVKESERSEKNVGAFPSRRIIICRGRERKKVRGGRGGPQLKERKKQHQFKPHASLWLRI